MRSLDKLVKNSLFRVKKKELTRTGELNLQEGGKIALYP